MVDSLGADGRHDLVVTVRGSELARACAARGWSYTQLAHRARISRPTMTAALRGRTVRPSTAFKILQALRAVEASESFAELVDRA